MIDLREYLHLLRREGQLVVVEAEVDADLEIAEIHRRVVAAGGPALYFSRVKDADFPCVTNLFGTPDRVDLAFGREPERLVGELVRLAEDLPSLSPGRLWRHRGLLGPLRRLGLRRVGRGPVIECVQDPPRLSRLPLLRTWPQDGGAFVTLPLVYTEHPETGRHNLGMYRVQRYDDHTTGMHWQIQKGGGFHHAVAERRDESLPVTVFIGGPPALMLAAVAPLPEDLPELILASLLQGERLQRLASPSGGLPLIARAEFAVEGKVPPRVRRPEGPFGDHYGYYSLQHEYPVLEVSRVYHRRGAIYPATVVGKPPQEDLYLGNYIQRLMAPLSRLVMPAVQGIWSYGETGYHCLSAMAVEERYPREALKFAFRVLGEDGGQLALTKFLVVTTPGVELSDFRQVLAHVLARTRFETDLFVIANLAMDSLDYTGPQVNRGSKGILIGLGEPVRELPRELRGDLPAGAAAAEVFCPGCLAVQGPAYSSAPGWAADLARDPAVAAWPLVVVLDDVRAARGRTSFLWSTFTRFEPAADIHAARVEVRRYHPCLMPPVVFDCRRKPGYPDEVIAAPETVARVTRRWREYFPAGDVAGAEDPRGEAGFGRLD
ncbi:MAG: UbiD family decarboxylase [Candidatus Latescibacterota bacterium]|jgi:UbiD family decarboxylase